MFALIEKKYILYCSFTFKLFRERSNRL